MINRKAQSVVEYGILIGIVAAAILVMQTYMKRGVQAGIKVSVDEFADQKDFPTDSSYAEEKAYSRNDASSTYNIAPDGGQILSTSDTTKSRSYSILEGEFKVK